MGRDPRGLGESPLSRKVDQSFWLARRQSPGNHAPQDQPWIPSDTDLSHDHHLSLERQLITLASGRFVALPGTALELLWRTNAEVEAGLAAFQLR
jgi:hypothetical protein